MARLLDRLDLEGLKCAISQIAGCDENVQKISERFLGMIPEGQLLPTSAEAQAAIESDDQGMIGFLALLHKLLMDTDVILADMVCQGCNHVYKISDGIPNMLLQSDEV